MNMEKSKALGYLAQLVRLFSFLVCAKALPATLLEALLYLPSFRILDAVEATDLLVCLVFAMNLTPPFFYDM